MKNILLDETAKWGTGIVQLSLDKKSAVMNAPSAIISNEPRSRDGGKWYWEVTINSSNSISTAIGVSGSTYPDLSPGASGGNNIHYYIGGTFRNTSMTTYKQITTAPKINVGETVGIGVDTSTGNIYFYKNNSLFYTSPTGYTLNNLTGSVFYPYIAENGGTTISDLTVNFGATPFKYSIPDGYRSYDDRQPYLNKILLLPADGQLRKIEKEILLTTTAIPLMTSDNSPEGNVIYSSQNPSFPAYKAFNQANGNDWSPTTTINEYIGFKFKQPKVIYKYNVRRGTHTTMSNSPKDWTFEASNNGVDWTVLDTQNNHVWTTASQEKEFVINNNKPFFYYRLFIKEGGNTSQYYIGELLMFEKYLGSVVEVQFQNEQSFLNHGMSQQDLASIDMSSEFTEKHYIQDKTTTLGEGKVFKHDLDMTKTIKKLSVK